MLTCHQVLTVRVENQHKHVLDVCEDLSRTQTERAAATDRKLGDYHSHFTTTYDNLDTKLVTGLTDLDRAMKVLLPYSHDTVCFIMISGYLLMNHAHLFIIFT